VLVPFPDALEVRGGLLRDSVQEIAKAIGLTSHRSYAFRDVPLLYAIELEHIPERDTTLRTRRKGVDIELRWKQVLFPVSPEDDLRQFRLDPGLRCVLE
jgi:hypothetical protein